MTEAEALAAIEAESLPRPLWMQRPDGNAMSTAIFEDGEMWHVVAIGERGAVEDDTTYRSESAALEDFIERLRVAKTLIDNAWA